MDLQCSAVQACCSTGVLLRRTCAATCSPAAALTSASTAPALMASLWREEVLVGALASSSCHSSMAACAQEGVAGS
jgi:hypothetical protein